MEKVIESHGIWRAQNSMNPEEGICTVPESLTAFVCTGHCKVDETEKGWFIAYIDRDPETIERQKVKNVMIMQHLVVKVMFNRPYSLYLPSLHTHL